MREWQIIRNSLIKIGAHVNFIMGGNSHDAEIVDKNNDFALISCVFGKFAAPLSAFSVSDESNLQLGKARASSRSMKVRSQK